MFPQQAALQTPSLQAAANCPRPRSAACPRLRCRPGILAQYPGYHEYPGVGWGSLVADGVAAARGVPGGVLLGLHPLV